jgi:putative ABC transport system permease protein
MKIPLLRGRHFTEEEARTSGKVTIISETMANRFFPNEDPVGKRLLFGEAQDTPYEIVGVVGDVRHRALNIGVYQTMYFPWLRERGTNIVIRASAAPVNLAAEARNALQAVDKNLPVSAIRPMEEWVGNSVAQRRLIAFLLSAFASLALALAMIGVYGVMSQAVAQSTHEIGVRLALGAQPRDVLALVLREGMKLGLVGLAIGLLGALALTRLATVQSLLFDVSGADPLTFAAIAVLLTGAMLLACYLPARRATKVDPMVALRCE